MLENPLILDDHTPQSEQVISLVRDFCKNPGTVVTQIGAVESILKRDPNVGLLVLCVADYIKGVTLILNRVKSIESLYMLPVLLISGLGHEDAANFLAEMPCTHALARPASGIQISKALSNLNLQSKWYTSQLLTIESTMSRIQRSADQLALENTLDQSGTFGVSLGFIFAEAALTHRHFELAEAAYRWILQKQSQNLRAIAGLGRLLFLMERREEAAAYLRMARRQSKANIDRLCMLGEIAMLGGNLRNATKSFQEASNIDSAHVRVRAGLEVASSFSKAIAYRAGEGLALSLIQTYNMVAISHVNDRHMETAKTIYLGALKIAIDPLVRARLEFNLGLCYLKWKKISESVGWLQKAVQTSEGTFERPAEYLKKLGIGVLYQAPTNPNSLSTSNPVPQEPPTITDSDDSYQNVEMLDDADFEEEGISPTETYKSAS